MSVEFEAVVPMKLMTAGKSRLRSFLPAVQREQLVLTLMRRVIGACHCAKSVVGVSVMTDDPRIAAAATQEGASTIPENGSGLNEGLANAARDLAGAGASGLILLPGDLGWVTGFSIDCFLGRLVSDNRWPAAAALATDQTGTGTSALAWHPDEALFTPAFGPGSAARHSRMMMEHGLNLDVRRCDPAFADVDTFSDYRRWFGADGLATAQREAS